MASASFHISLHVRGLDARRGGRIVAHGVTFSLAPGEALTLRGANGTGKTSILRAIAGFSKAPDGAIAFSEAQNELDPGEIRARHIHWLGGGDGISARLTVKENFNSWMSLAGQPPDHDALEQVGLGQLSDRAASTLSTGQKRRLGLARIIALPRALWLLDEPLNGLDDQGRALVLSAIARHRQGGGLVLMASHDDGLPGAPVLRLASQEAAQ